MHPIDKAKAKEAAVCETATIEAPPTKTKPEPLGRVSVTVELNGGKLYLNKSVDVTASTTFTSAVYQVADEVAAMVRGLKA